jgi:hypothetical protein
MTEVKALLPEQLGRPQIRKRRIDGAKRSVPDKQVASNRTTI